MIYHSFWYFSDKTDLIISYAILLFYCKNKYNISMSNQLNYYSRYNRIKDHQNIDSLLSILSRIKLYPFKIRNIIPDE